MSSDSPENMAPEKKTALPTTREDLAEHMHLVHRIVAQFVRRLPRSVQREDLVAAGTLGLFNALRTSGHVRASCEEMFASYARIRIRGAILDELRRHDWSPRRRRTPATPATNATPGSTTPATATTPVAPLATAPNGEEPKRAPIHVIGFDDVSPQALGTFLAESGDAAGASTWGTRSPLDELEEKSAHAALRRSVEELPARERAIIQMRYFEGMPSKAIASTLGLSEARISQLHARATARLRAILAAEGEELDLAA